MIGNGVGPLVEVLASNSKLESLDLRNNRIGPAGAEAVARMLETNKSLVKLDLRWNEIGSAGAEALLNAFRVNRTLKQLELAGNKIPEGLMSQLEAIVRGEETAVLS
jgi:Ran GTPase-activating protein (RanGAP) involved in mRNA processing and transport